MKNPPDKAGDIRDAGSISGSGRSPGGGHGNSLRYSCLENLMNRGAWRATVHGVAESRTRLRDSVCVCVWLYWLAKKFILAFPHYLTENPERTFGQSNISNFLLIYMPLFIPIPYCLYYHNFILSLKIRYYEHHIFVPLFQNYFGYSRSFAFPYKFKNPLFNF